MKCLNEQNHLNNKYRNFKRFLLFFILFLFLFYFLSNSNANANISYTKEMSQIFEDNFTQDGEKNLDPSLYRLDINKNRLNKLFRILDLKESKYSWVNSEMNLISFKHIKDYFLLNSTQDKNLLMYKNEIDEYLRLGDKQNQNVQVNDKFIQYLTKISNFYSYEHPRDSVLKKKIQKTENKPAILLAGNYKYYEPLKNSLQIIRKFFPDLKVFVYDLGLSKTMNEEIKALCNCEINKFDPSGELNSISSHIHNMNTYSWKPIIIQETLNKLNKHDTLIYIDTSIKFKSNEIGSIIETCKDIGILTRYLSLNLPCFTDDRMFEWFGDNKKTFRNFQTLEANFIIINKNFLSSLIMKAWVTCALDESCIAPKGSHIYGSVSNWINGCSEKHCGCHRFDQDAFTIINSYFYGFPQGSDKKPPISFTFSEMFFFEVKRRSVFEYIIDQINSIFV